MTKQGVTITCCGTKCFEVFPHTAAHKTRADAEKEAHGVWYYARTFQGFKLYMCPPCWLKENPGQAFHPVTVLAVAFALIRTQGWVSKEDADKRDEVGTAERVVWVFKGIEPMPDILTRDITMANDAVSWYMTRRTGHADVTAYEREVAAAIWWSLTDGGVWVNGRPSLSGKTIVYSMAKIASGAIAYRDGVRKAQRKQTWKSLSASQRVGKPNEVLTDFVVTVTHVRAKTREFTGRDGEPNVKTLHTYKLLDDLGNAYKWFETTTRLAEGQRVLIKRARIVRYETYSGVEFTILTRCKTAYAV
ncbi:hypothetical protein [Nonomuraea gerenzanensis]|uniref:hypothetical protein n=1 Tax=Nonomuraea gerenzanensis TaxID=93944 RepID=UPI001CDA4CBE|nr:hypothetical protein [Nonomuraea gerenzanensis]UBU12930.1 hypothetical protein LCN96_53265 [Nonomuraea gerenzanensis]